MANSISRIYSKQDNKYYNVQQLNAQPVVVFGRTIKEKSIPGTQYYFQDGFVKLHNPESTEYGGYNCFRFITDDLVPCIFTVPENFVFPEKDENGNLIITDEYRTYARQFCKSAIKLNANTTSPYYIIRNGVYICIKAFQFSNLFKHGLEKNNYSISIMLPRTVSNDNNELRYYRISRMRSRIRHGIKLTGIMKNRLWYRKSKANISNLWIRKNQEFIQPYGKRRKQGSIYIYRINKYCPQILIMDPNTGSYYETRRKFLKVTQ